MLYLIVVALGILIGKLSDKLLTPEAVKQGKRRTMVIVFMALSSIVLLITVVNNEILVLLLISLSLTCISSAITLNIALTNDLVSDPSIAGTAFGILILGALISFMLTRKSLTFDKAVLQNR